MKNLILCALLAMGTMFISCSSDDDAGPEETFVATIDGTSFVATSVVAVEDNSFGEPIVFMTGTEASSGNVIGLNIPLSTPTGSSIAIDATDFAITFTDADQNAFFTVGQITPTELDASSKTVAGTFSFTATDDTDSTNVVEVTNGEFRVIYP